MSHAAHHLHHVHHVIMAGGSGTRFWPAGRAARPKQFLALFGEGSLIHQTWQRAVKLSGPENVWVAAGASQRAAVLAELPGLDPSRFIAEPVGRNTAPCIGLAAIQLARTDPDGVMIVAPADHLYTRPEVLAQALGVAVAAARSAPALVTLGIRPMRPETGFGYIEVGAPASFADPRAVAVERFVEKPDARTAASYLASGRHLWNSGLFVWRIAAILDAIRACAPDLWIGLREIDAAWDTPSRQQVIEQIFPALPSISIDYAVMEKASGVLVVPADPGWSDVGSWDAVADLGTPDVDGNIVLGGPSGAVLLRDARGCLVVTAPGGSGATRSVAVVGAGDLIIVDTPDALLVCRRGDSQAVREVVSELKSRGRGDLV